MQIVVVRDASVFFGPLDLVASSANRRQGLGPIAMLISLWGDHEVGDLVVAPA